MTPQKSSFKEDKTMHYPLSRTYSFFQFQIVKAGFVSIRKGKKRFKENG